MPNESEVSEVVFSDAENLPLVASLCRWQRYKAVMPDPIGHPHLSFFRFCSSDYVDCRVSIASRGISNKEKNNETKEQRRSPEIEQGAEEEPGRDRKIQRFAI